MKTKKQSRTKKVTTARRKPLPVIERPKGKRKPITSLSPDKVELIKLQRKYAALVRKTREEISLLTAQLEAARKKYEELLELRTPSAPAAPPLPVDPPSPAETEPLVASTT